MKCFRCGNDVSRKPRGWDKVFCGRKCFWLSRRSNKTTRQKVEEKRLYDIQYRATNLAIIKAKKKEFHAKTYNPVKAAKERKKTMARHVEYCRQPQYKEYKKEYDLKYRSKNNFGPFWESAIIVLRIANEVTQRMTKTEIYSTNGTINKAQKRRREYEANFDSNKS